MPLPLRIGIDLGGTKIEAIALSPDGTILARRRVTTPKDDAPATITAIACLVKSIEAESIEAESIEAGRTEAESGATEPPERTRVGICTPGSLSPATGLIRNSNSVCLNGLPLDRKLAEAIGHPVRIANDADCFALSEATDGAGAGAGIVFGVILGTGVGGGIVLGGRLLAGCNAVAGEWGHNPLPRPTDDERPGPPCYCGHRGCIETFLSGPGFAADHGGGLTAIEIAAAATAGDATARAALERYIDRLARALASIINVIDPHMIVLGGGMSNVETLYEAVPARWGRYVFSDSVTTRLVPARHGDSSGVRGAAWLWDDPR